MSLWNHMLAHIVTTKTEIETKIIFLFRPDELSYLDKFFKNLEIEYLKAYAIYNIML